MFFRKNEITLNRVHDTVCIREGDERLTLKVDADPNRIIAGLSYAGKLLQALTAESTEEQRHDAIMYYARSIFGPDQAEKLLDFYHGDAGCVVNVCGKYFSERLAKKITKAQKKQ